MAPAECYISNVLIHLGFEGAISFDLTRIATWYGLHKLVDAIKRVDFSRKSCNANQLEIM